jgi:hypothetical protein
MENWKTLRLAIREDKQNDFFGELRLDKVPLTDHIEWTVWMQRIRPNKNYTKNYGWFHTEEEAQEVFNLIIFESKKGREGGQDEWVEKKEDDWPEMHGAVQTENGWEV